MQGTSLNICMRIAYTISSKMCEFQDIRFLIFKTTHPRIIACKNAFFWPAVYLKMWLMGPPSASTTARSLGFHWSMLFLMVPSDTSSQAAMIAAHPCWRTSPVVAGTPPRTERPSHSDGGWAPKARSRSQTIDGNPTWVMYVGGWVGMYGIWNDLANQST